jgi:hypothetical protein
VHVNVVLRGLDGLVKKRVGEAFGETSFPVIAALTSLVSSWQ